MQIFSSVKSSQRQSDVQPSLPSRYISTLHSAFFFFSFLLLVVGSVAAVVVVVVVLLLLFFLFFFFLLLLLLTKILEFEKSSRPLLTNNV